MKINNAIDRYFTTLNDMIFKYAYENYNMGPIMDLVEVEWFGEIFDVSNMEKDLHEDIIQDLKTKGVYWTIKEKFDKFVILPDVFSAGPVPLYKDRNEYDTSRRQVVLINNYVLELKEAYYDKIKYNHNGKCYYFYDSESDVGDMFSKGNHIEVINLYDFAFMYDFMKWNWPEQERLHINIDKNNKLIFIKAGNLGIGKLAHNAYLGAGATATEYIGIAPMAPFIEFDYEENNPNPETSEQIPGLKSMAPDAEVMERIYGVDEYDNYVYFHNRDVLLSNTILIVYKDNSYFIDNVYKTGGVGKFARKLDKHTILLPKDDNIMKVFVFTRPFNFKDYDRIDTVYDQAMANNSRAFMAMEKHKKFTNTLFDLMVNREKLPLSELIEYGYRYDLDVLKVIQNYFKVFNDIDITRNVLITKEINGEKLHQPMLAIRSVNRLNNYPIVFINDRMYDGSIMIKNSYDIDTILIPTEFILKKILGSSFNIAKKSDYDKLYDVKFLEDTILNYIKCVHVVYIPKQPIDKVHIDTGMAPPRVMYKPLYNGEIVCDIYGEDFENPTLYTGYQFINGLLSSTSFKYDENNIARSKFLFRRLDGIGTFDFDYKQRTFTTSTTATPQNIYNPSHKIDGKFSIYQNKSDLSMMINRVEEKIDSVIKVNFNKEFFTKTYNSQDHATVTPVEVNLKERSTIFFDKYGFMINDKIKVLGKNHINMTTMYNYKHTDELTDDIVVHGMSLDLTNYVNGVDLEIDYDRIDPLNTGSFNDECMADPIIVGLFNPNIHVETNIEPPFQLKSIDKLLGEKILTRYWVGPMGNAYDNAKLVDEVRVLNGKWINTDGSLGDIPDINKDFINNKELISDKDSLNIKWVSLNIFYKMILDSDIGMDTSRVIINAIINSDGDYERPEVDPLYDHYIDLSDGVLRMKMLTHIGYNYSLDNSNIF